MFTAWQTKQIEKILKEWHFCFVLVKPPSPAPPCPHQTAGSRIPTSLSDNRAVHPTPNPQQPPPTAQIQITDFIRINTTLKVVYAIKHFHTRSETVLLKYLKSNNIPNRCVRITIFFISMLWMVHLRNLSSFKWMTIFTYFQNKFRQSDSPISIATNQFRLLLL